MMAKKKVKAPVQKNEEVTAVCEDFTHEGLGVAKVDGYPLFTPYLIPGEKAKIKVVKVNKQYGYGKLLELLTGAMTASNRHATFFTAAAAANCSILLTTRN